MKTDKVDATTIAELARGKLIPEAWKTEKRQRELRELTRGRLKWLHLRHTVQNHVRSAARRYNVAIHSSHWRNLVLLKKQISGQLPEEVYVQVRISLDLLAYIQKSIHQIEKEIDRHVWYQEDLERLLSIPGIGRVSAWTILAKSVIFLVFQRPRNSLVIAAWFPAAPTVVIAGVTNPPKTETSIFAWHLVMQLLVEWYPKAGHPTGILKSRPSDWETGWLPEGAE